MCHKMACSWLRVLLVSHSNKQPPPHQARDAEASEAIIMTMIMDKPTLDMFEQNGVYASEAPPSPAVIALMEGLFAEVLAGADQRRESSALSVGGVVETDLEADEVCDRAGQSEETEPGSQRRDGSGLRKSTVRPSASDSPGETPRVTSGCSPLENALDEDDPTGLAVQLADREPEVLLHGDSFESEPGTDPETSSESESNRTPSDGRRRQSEAREIGPEPAESDGSATYRLCAETINKLNGPEQKLPVEERQAMMVGCLDALLTEFDLNQEVMMTLVDMLHHGDAESYLKYARAWVRRGLFVSAGSLDPVTRYAWNKVTIVRPCLIDDLGLTDTDDIAMLDVGLGAYIQYLELATDIRQLNWNEPNRNMKQVAVRAQVSSAAQSSLKIYLGIMKDFRRNKAKKDAEDSGGQRSRPDRSHRSARTVEKSVVGEKILSEYEEANSAGRSSPGSVEEMEVQS